MVCPKCEGSSIITIDMERPPRLFECASCRHRFHVIGFDANDIEIAASAPMSGMGILMGFYGRQ